MNCDTGEVVRLEDLSEGKREALTAMLSRGKPLSELQMEVVKPYAPIDEKDVPKVKHMSKARRRNWMRNKLCLCGSGKKFKKCCWSKFAG